jgi:transglutaminase-like putative cysteine protease
MKSPPLLLGAALLFWGAMSGCLPLAVLLAVLVEGPQLRAVRWEVTARDFDRTRSLCALLFLGAGVLAISASQGPQVLTGWLWPGAPAAAGSATAASARGVLAFLQWWPLVFYPFVLAQALSRQTDVDWRSFSAWFRWRAGRGRPPASGGRMSNFADTYFAICLGAACIGQHREVFSFPALALLLGWALWRVRSRRFALVAWVPVVGVAVGLGFLGQRGLQQLYPIVQGYNPAWLGYLIGGRADAQESRTAIGSIGRLKLSGKILWRLETPAGQPPPERLRQASYSSFKSATWFTVGAEKDFTAVTPESDLTTWPLCPTHPGPWSVTLSGSLPGRRGLLAVPGGSMQLTRLDVAELATNHLGALHAEGAPGLLSFATVYGPGPGIDGAPVPADYVVPDKELPAIAQLADELKLAGQPPERALRIVSGFFADKFHYTLKLTGATAVRGGTNLTPLTAFLLRDRAGHCEYFATATALLLRQAGLPTRYAVGYGVSEAGGRGYIVRERHAHAWCLVFLNGAWRDCDTTPASWAASDAAPASFFEPLADAWSRLWFEFAQFRYAQTGLRKYLVWLVLLLAVVVLGQWLFGRKWRRARKLAPLPAVVDYALGLDSEVFLIERELAKKGFRRAPGETLAAWLRRLETLPGVAAQLGSLVPLRQLHNRHRFDPVGLSAAERESLRSLAQACLRGLRQSTP